MSGYLRTALTLGQRTGEMHLALASDASDQAFAPETFDKKDLDAVTGGTLSQAHRALGALDRALSDGALPPELVVRAEELLTARDTVLEHIRSAPALEFSASKIRVHGDYHLGQVLWTEGDFYILDFEGEPARPLHERRVKQSPLKDVAGMVRSFSYAAHAGLFALGVARPDQVEHLEPWAQLWQTWATGAFLQGYLTAVDRALFLPAEASQRDALLRLFVLDKALYELNYELNNRPEWVRIPLLGILDLLRADNGA
jgi:maltose alpha-D-glucosyltransferase / alpha-amylase